MLQYKWIDRRTEERSHAWRIVTALKLILLASFTWYVWVAVPGWSSDRERRYSPITSLQESNSLQENIRKMHCST